MEWDPVTHYQDVAVAERYDRERFSSLTGKIFNALERSALRSAFRDIGRDRTVLDLPCGTGRMAEVLLEEGFQVLGADISPAMLDVARRKLNRFGSRFRTRVADVHELAKRETGICDVALCARVLMHFPLREQIEFLRAVAALSRDIVVFTQSYTSPYQNFRRGIKRLLGNRPPSVYPIDERDLGTLLSGAGLEEVRRVRPMALLSEAMIVVARHA